MSKDTDGAVAVLGCVGIIPVTILGIILKAWAIVTLWGWFIYPMWHIAVPSNKAAVGLSILFAAIHAPSTESKAEKNNDSALWTVTKIYGRLVLSPVMSVAMGWLVNRWM